MKRLLCLCSLVCVSAVCYAQNAEKVISLEESITLGLKNNQQLLALQERMVLADERVSEALSNVMPKIDFNFNVSKFDNQFPSILPASFDSVYLPASRTDQFFSTRLSLWQYLYAGGRYHTTRTLAETNLSQAISEVEIVRHDVTRDVKLVYIDYLAQSERVKAHEAALEAARAGKVPAVIAAVQHALLSEQHNLDKARLRLLAAVGMELTAAVDVSGTLATPLVDFDVNKGIAWAFQYRPELKQTQFQEKIDSLRVNLSLTERLPTVSMGANYEWVGDQFPLNEKNWNATINVNLPVFDGWAAWSRIKQRRRQARETAIRRAEIEDQVRLQVRDAALDYDFWKKQASALDTAENGDAEKRLQQRLRSIDTLREARRALAVLEWAVGTALK